MASGVLPIAVGRAARLFDYLNRNKQKEYIAEFRFGFTTDTLDVTGTVTGENQKIPSGDEIADILPRFTGGLMQIPPAFSAKYVNGVRAYDLARRGIMAELKPAAVTVYELEPLGAAGADGYRFRRVCSGGTYIRALARDIAEASGTLGVMSALRRTRAGGFCAADCVRIADVSEASLITVPEALALPRYDVPDAYAKQFTNGVGIPADFSGDRLIYCGGELYGLGSAVGGTLKLSAYFKE
jgi:tRNA pseudouridine55 synthase